jgi:hypothetical protein
MAVVYEDSGQLNGTDGVSTRSVSITTPAANELIVVDVAVHRADRGVSTVKDQNGDSFTQILKSSSTSSASPQGSLWYKIADGDETSIELVFGGSARHVVSFAIYSGLDATSPLEASNQDESNIATSVTSQGTNSATPTNADGVAVYGFACVNGLYWDDPFSSSAGTIRESVPVNGYVGGAIADEIYSSASSKSTTFSTTDTGAAAWGAVAVFKATAGGGVTGDLAAQETGADTATVTGTVIVQGDLSAQESGTDTASLNGSVLVSGDLSVQEVGADTGAFDGSATTDITGDLIVQETGPDTAALTGSITVQGDLSAQETGPDTATIIGAGPVAITGDLAAQESGSDTAAMAGLVLVAGTLSVQEIGADGAVINGTVHVSGTLAAQETGADDATFIGTGPVPVTGDLVVQEVGSDHLVIAGYISVAGTLSVQETGPDGAVITGSVLVTGAMLATETGADTAAGTGSVIITGDLAVQEIGADTAFLSFEEPGLTGNLIVQESTADKASFLALFPTCHAWSNYDLAQAKLNAALIDVFGESVMFDPTGYQYPVTALFEVTGPENSGSRSRDVQDIGNTESYRPRPYLMMRTSDVADLDIKARQTVIVRGKNMTVVSDPVNDGQCMTMVYVRGDF